MNKVILTGNLANDPEKRTTQNGFSQCTFRLAVQRRYAAQGGERLADFLNIVCWRQTADFAAQYLKKGRKIAVEGRIENRSYDAQDGSKRYVTEIIAENIEALGGKRDDNEGAAPGGGVSAEERKAGYTEVDDDELPF